MNKKTIIIMGNGPSLADINFADLNGFDTFGLNSAYRAYERMNWWPTYHGCFDYRVTENHQDNFINLIENTPIKKSFYIINISNHKDFQFVNMQKFWNYLEK